MNLRKFMLLFSFSVILVLSITLTCKYTQANSINVSDEPKTDLPNTTETQITDSKIITSELITPEFTTPEITESELITKPKPNLETVVVSNGFTLLQNGGATITKGAQIDLDINFPITCIQSHQLKDLLDSNNNIFKPDEIKDIKNNSFYENNQLGTILLRNMFSLKFKNTFYNWFLESINIQAKTEEDDQRIFLEALYNMEQNNYILKGKVSFEGTSIIEKKVYCFIAVTHVTFNDGKKIRIINTEKPYVMDMNGNSYGINVLPESYLIYTNIN